MQHECVSNNEIVKLVSTNNEYLERIIALKEENERLRSELRFNAGQAPNGATHAEARSAAAIINSTAYRLGTIIINAITKPGKNTVLMPIMIGRLVFERMRKIG